MDDDVFTKPESPKNIKEIVLGASEGLFSTLFDFTLFTLFLSVTTLGKSRSSWGIYQASEDANNLLAKFNYEKIKNTLYNLKRVRLIDYKPKDMEKTLRITREGKQRLSEILPAYKTTRTWDGKIFLITYDIPEKDRRSRDVLRDFLIKIGAGKLQYSVYITPYNPRFTLKKFIKERNLDASVIISDLGQGAIIGNESLENLISRIYHLDSLEKGYREFIANFSNRQKDKQSVAFAFLNTLFRDPQLPFELLPADWPGNKAFKLYQSLTDTN